MAKNIKSISVKLRKAKKPEIYVDQIKREINLLTKYTEFFSVKLSKEAKKIISIQDGKGFIDLIEKQEHAKEVFNKSIKTKGATLYNKSIEAWKRYNETEYRKGLSDNQKKLLAAYINQTDLNNTYLRANDIELETSKAVKLPVDVAKRYYNWYNKIKVKGCDNCGYKMLDYEVKKADETGLIIGCHNITATEIKEIATKLNW